MREIIAKFKIEVLKWLEARLTAKVAKLQEKLEVLKGKIAAERARVQKRIK